MGRESFSHVPGRSIVCIGASAGGLQPLRQLIADLPGDLAASVFVVVHMSADNPGVLPRLLGSEARMPVEVPEDDQPIENARIYVAPPDYHLLVKRARIRVVRGPRENRFRPAIDPLFRTAAAAYGRRVIGVVLSGGLDDGASGMLAIRRAGGVAIVQDPAEAYAPQMPLSALSAVEADFVLGAAAIGGTIHDLVQEPLQGLEPESIPADDIPDPAEVTMDALRSGRLPPPPSSYTCPECGGALWQVGKNEDPRYQCHVGHAFTAANLIVAKRETLERALWTALRVLEEDVSLRKRMADRARGHWPSLADKYDDQAASSAREADAIRSLLLGDGESKRAESVAAPRARGRADARQRGKRAARRTPATGTRK